MSVNDRSSGRSLIRIRSVFAVASLLVAAGFILGLSSFSRRAAQSGRSPLSRFGPDAPSSSSSAAQLPPTPTPSLKHQAVSFFRGLPLIFEPNVGQMDMAQKAAHNLKGSFDSTDAAAKFLAHGSGYNLFFTSDSTRITLHGRAPNTSDSVNMKLVGANPSARLHGDDVLPGKTNYLIGGDPDLWRSNIPQFARVRYESIYPGIDLLFYGHQGQLEYDFQVAPGADPAQAELEFQGAKHLELSQGNLIVKGEGGDVRLEAPRAYQQIDGRQQPVASRFVLRADNRVAFALGAYDRSRELVIDPILTYSTYFGGSGDEICPSFVPGSTGTPACPAIAVDNIDDIYLVGATNSPATSFPQPISGTPTLLGTNANVYVAKLDPSGQTLLYLTFLGGGGTDVSAGAAVDGAGFVYLAGTTTSGLNGTATFPTTSTNTYQSAPLTGSTGTAHVFVSVLEASGGSFFYSSYLSGNGTDIASGMAIDSNADLFVTGSTTSTNVSGADFSIQFPASSLPEGQPFQAFPRAIPQFFVTKVNTKAAASTSIAYSTYFGGGVPASGAIAVGGGIAVDSTGNIYFSGTTNYEYTGNSSGTDFPILDAYQPCLNTAPPAINTNPQMCPTNTAQAPPTDAFAAKLNINPNIGGGSGQLVWSTYFGGENNDTSTGIALDSALNAYLTGSTNSPDISKNILNTTTVPYQPFQDCLNTPVNPSGGVSGCPTPSGTPPTDAYVVRLTSPSGNTIQTLGYFSYLGGSNNDAGQAITLDSANGALITGFTQSTDFPVLPNPSPIQSTLHGTQDAFLARLNTAAITGQGTTGSYSTYFGGGQTSGGGAATNAGTSVVLDSALNTYFAGVTNAAGAAPNGIQTAAPLQPNNNGGYDAFAVKLGLAADLAISGTLSLGPGQTYVSAGEPAQFIYTVANNGPDLATNVTVTDNWSQPVTGIALTFGSASATSGSNSPCNTPSGSTVPIICTIPSLQSGATATVTINLIPTVGGNFNGGAVVVSAPNNSDPNPANNTTTVPGLASDFTASISPVSQTVPAAGDTATYTIFLTPVPIYGSNVALSCSGGLPAGASCNFTSNSVSLTGGPVSATLNLATTARPAPVANARPWPRRFLALWLAVPGLALIGVDRRRRRLLGVWLCLLVFGLLALQPACTSTAVPPTTGGTPPGTYQITLTAAGGSDTKNVFFNITVP